ncbi:MAG: DNA helicase UvrBC [Candidatus Poribacteria bacterium]
MSKNSRSRPDLAIEALDGALAVLDYDEDTQIRVLTRDDGREVVVVQANAFNVSRLYVTGRPDGRRVDGYDSYFELVLDKVRAHKQEHGADVAFEMDTEAWDLLFTEAYDRYLRYLFFSGLDRWEDVKRDTDENLIVCAWAMRYADEETAWRVYQHKGYILMMNSISRAELALEEGDESLADRAIARGIDKIGVYCRECVLADHTDAEALTRDHYLANMLKYRADLVTDGRLEDASREDPRNVV